MLEVWVVAEHLIGVRDRTLGGDVGEVVTQIIERYRLSLYPESVTIDRDAAERVAKSQEIAGLLKPGNTALGTVLDMAALEAVDAGSFGG